MSSWAHSLLEGPLHGVVSKVEALSVACNPRTLLTRPSDRKKSGRSACCSVGVNDSEQVHKNERAHTHTHTQTSIPNLP